MNFTPGRRAIRRRRTAVCLCDCGKHTRVDVAELGTSTKSCGCLRRERMIQMSQRHHMSRSPEYSVWHMMKDRCYNPRAKAFKYYGGRGITVCDRWLDFANFFADMGPRPSISYSLDRLDNERGYEPENCVWTSMKAQARNRRSTRIMTAFGKTQCLSDWAAEYGIGISCLSSRLRKGVPFEDALTLQLNDPRLRHRNH